MFKAGKDEPGIPITEGNRPDEFTTSDADSTVYLRWMTPGSFGESDVFTENTTKKVVICRMKTVGGAGKNEGAYDLWTNRATANYVPWSLTVNIIK